MSGKIWAVFLAVLLLIAMPGTAEPTRVVQAEEILQKIELGQPVKYDNVIVEGNLDRSGLELQRASVERTELEKAIGFPNYEFIVSSPIDISNSVIKGSMNLNMTVFQNSVIFQGTIFIEPAFLIGSRFNRTAGFRQAQFNQTAHFSGAQFNQTAGFWEAQFKQTAGFWEAQFNQTADFREAQFNQTAGFREAQFNQTADFSGAQFNQTAVFSGAQFNQTADFFETQFNEIALFDQVRFNDAVSFTSACFNHIAEFIYTYFNKDAWFTNAQFNQIAYFVRVEFNRTAGFYGSQFNQVADFSADLPVITLKDGVEISWLELSNRSRTWFNSTAYFDSTQFNQLAFFNDARFIDLSLDWGQFSNDIVFAGAQINGTLSLYRTKYDTLNIRWSSINDLAYDDTAYHLLIQNFNKLGFGDDARECQYSYRCKHREELFRQHKFDSWLFDLLAWASYGYGLRPVRPLGWAALLILMGGLFFFLTGSVTRSKETASGKKPLALRRKEEKPEGNVSIWESLLLSATYFTSGASSIISATPTEFVPVSRGRYVVVILRLLGWIFFVLFLSSLTRTV